MFCKLVVSYEHVGFAQRKPRQIVFWEQQM